MMTRTEAATKTTSNSVNVGNAGEHLIMAELLARGYHAFMADRGNPAFDLAAILPDRRQVKIRCKTCSTNRTFQYSAKKTGEIFLDFDPQDNTDFAALIAPRKAEVFTSRTAEIWIVPTAVMNHSLWQMNAAYFSTPKRDGTPRKQQSTPWFTMQLDGPPEKSPLNGWAQKLETWHENWEFSFHGPVLKSTPEPDLQIASQ